ncbi:hypothetical protein RI685_16680 (plasmid) [Clavibacter michiganensis]|uniref:hypothetical protein n=1 Tax=Clavibacter michiganensis TaxID=28447 RepID=UPI003DA06F1F
MPRGLAKEVGCAAPGFIECGPDERAAYGGKLAALDATDFLHARGPPLRLTNGDGASLTVESTEDPPKPLHIRKTHDSEPIKHVQVTRRETNHLDLFLFVKHRGGPEAVERLRRRRS